MISAAPGRYISRPRRLTERIRKTCRSFICATTRARTYRFPRSRTSKPITARNSPCATTSIAAHRSSAALPPVIARSRQPRPRRCFPSNDAPRNGLRLHGHVLSGTESAARCASLGHFRTFTSLRLSDSCGALRKLDVAIQRPAEYSRGGIRRSRSSVASSLYSRTLHAAVYGPDGERRLHPDWSGNAHRAGRQEFHPYRRVRQRGLRPRYVSRRCSTFGGEASVPAADDDRARLYCRVRAAMDSVRRRLSRATDYRNDRDRRHAGGDVYRQVLCSSDLLRRREILRR